MATLATSGLSFDETVHTSSRIYHHYTTNSFIKNRRSAECIMQLIQGKLKAYPWVIFRWLAKVGWNVHQVAPVSSGTHFGHFVPRRSRNGWLVAGPDVSHDENEKPNGERCDHGVTKTD
ncbi:hypothetical protein DAPPUDRAFT_98196 [Daphnia pulex]|uniref:Uncharacterized protein n=1 Tax=Daphnia pulex TaxID=6669 RepID=E9G2L4_DAPPU|nr:hypothetical protein DAPPUDRAFT_98196 [Daphnia pulex]|eukprot:EFX86297.1 hypothetical protein DAPPUDRAFT_98196 [Daphnia pulex]